MRSRLDPLAKCNMYGGGISLTLFIWNIFVVSNIIGKSYRLKVIQAMVVVVFLEVKVERYVKFA